MIARSFPVAIIAGAPRVCCNSDDLTARSNSGSDFVRIFNWIELVLPVTGVTMRAHHIIIPVGIGDALTVQIKTFCLYTHWK